MRFDAVIIGAGPSGLAAAGRLSHFGVRVCVLEAHRRLGGLSSWHHVAGREISSGLHAFTNYRADGKGMLGKLLRQLRVKPADLALKPQGRSSIRFPSATLFFTNDTEYIRQQVAAVFPGEIDGFDRFRALVRETDESETTAVQTSARDVMARFVRDPLLLDMLLCPVMFYGNPGGVGDGRDAERAARGIPDMDWLLFCVVWKCIFETGFAFPAAGMRPLWKALAARIREDGGEIRMNARVARLRRDGGGRVVAAVLDSGEEIEGDAFFSSAGGVETGALLGGGDAPGAEAERCLPVGEVSIAEGIAVLDALPEAGGLVDTTIFYSRSDRFRFGRPAGLVEEGNGVVCAPGNYLPQDPDGENIVKVTQLASHPAWRALGAEEYARAKRSVADGMAGVLRGFGVDLEVLRGRGEGGAGRGRYGWFDDVFTPLTLERFTGHAEGALYGSPVKSRSGATGAENLFLMGADQGFHGIVGAMLSGVAMVNLHLLAKRV